MKSKFLSLMIILAMVIGSFSLAYATPTDVIGTPVEEAVETLGNLGVLEGYPDGTFRPNNNITRAEYAAVVTRAKGLKKAADNSHGTTIFGDVPGSSWSSGYINVAVQEGLIKGMGIINGINTFSPVENITYEQAVTIVVRALGYETLAEANGGYPNGHLLIAAQEGLLQGVNGTKGMKATRAMVAQLTFNALEVPMAGTSGSNAVYLLNELRLINKAAASGNWGAINATTFAEAGITGVTASNIENLKSALEGLANGTNQNWSSSAIQGVFNNLVDGNKVLSAKALNATQIEIKFNTKLDPSDAITTVPYKVSISGVTFIGVPELSSDGKTLILTASAAINVNNAALVVEPIQTEENATLTTERYTKAFSYSDSTKAEIIDIESKTNSNIASSVKVKFSEPIQSLGTVKINGVVKGATGFAIGDDEANFTGLSLNASQTHTIQIINLQDRANNVSSIINETFTVEVDNVPPTVVLSKSPDKDNVIVFEFDKPVTVVSATAALVNGIVKDESLSNLASATAIAINPMQGVTKKYEMAVTSPFVTLSTRNLTVLIPSGIKDALGNEVAIVTKTVTLKKDTTDPKIDLVRFSLDSSGNVQRLILTADSTLDAKALVPAGTLKNQLTVVDPDGVLVDSSLWLGGLSQNAIAAGDKNIILTFATPGKLSGEYTITFALGLATDEADSPNSLKAKTVELDFGVASTSGTFTIVAGDVTSSFANIYDVDFGAPVKGGNVSGSATDVDNYTLNGSALPVGTTITLNSAKDIATITLPAESIATSDSGAVFTINNVKRLTGETIVSFTTTVATVDNVKPVMDSALLTNDNRLVVGFSEALAAMPTSTDFEIKINGKLVTTTPTFAPGTGSDAGKYVVDLNPLVLNDGTQTYIDIDGDLAYIPTNDIFVKTEASQSAFSMKSLNLVTSLTIKVIGGATTDTATPPNALKLGTLITLK